MIMSKDWSFSDEDNNSCGFRTVGVLVRENKILVQRERNGTEYALPGGHVKIGETSKESLIREYKEETGADIICERLIWVEELFWKYGDKNIHGIAFYYLIKLKNNWDIPDGYCEPHKDNKNVIIEWVTIGKMKNLTIYPQFIKEKIENISEHTEHFIRYS